MVGNTSQDALTHHRVFKSLPAVMINLVVILVVDFVFEHTKLVNGLKIADFRDVDEAELHILMKTILIDYASAGTPFQSK